MKKIFRKIICVSTCVIFTFNSYAAIVSDNDGSAFVTKAEFETLKNSFNSQIDNYNESIDGKIDGAISAYLAGISLARTDILHPNISIIKYPLKIINYLDGLVNLDSPVNNQTEPFFKPGYSFYGFIHRGASGNGRTGIGLLEIPASQKWPIWPNGTWNAATTKFTVTGMSSSLDYAFQGATYHDGDHSIADTEAYFLALDYASTSSGKEVNNCANNSSREKKGAAGGTDKLLVDYQFFTNTDGALKMNFTPGIFTSPSAGKTTRDIAFTYGATDALDTWKFKNCSYIWYNRVVSPDLLRSYTYSPSKSNFITELYNNGMYYDSGVAKYNNTSYKKYIAPVTIGANQTIYLTNLKKYRQIANNSDNTKSGWWIHYTKQSNTGFTYTGIITTGYNIESEYSGHLNSGDTYYHPKNQRSAIKQNDMYYVFNKEGTNIEHHMVDGIPLFAFDAAYGDEKIVNVTVDFNLTPQNAGNKKYAIFSTSPITTQLYNEDVESNVNYMKPISVNDALSSTRKVEVKSGHNSIKLPKCNGGQVLYMKLLWDDSVGEQYVSIDEPIITIVITD